MSCILLDATYKQEEENNNTFHSVSLWIWMHLKHDFSQLDLSIVLADTIHCGVNLPYNDQYIGHYKSVRKLVNNINFNL